LLQSRGFAPIRRPFYVLKQVLPLFDSPPISLSLKGEGEDFERGAGAPLKHHHIINPEWEELPNKNLRGVRLINNL